MDEMELPELTVEGLCCKLLEELMEEQLQEIVEVVLGQEGLPLQEGLFVRDQPR
jgi:hypothetical protein